MSDDDADQDDDAPARSKTLQQLLLLASEPFQFETQSLGTLTARSATMGMLERFYKALPDVDAASDHALVKQYLVNVAAHAPTSEQEAVRPMDSAEADQLVDEDLVAFSVAYLANVAETPANSPDTAVAEMAAYIRDQKRKLDESTRRLAASFSRPNEGIQRAIAAMTAHSTLMKNWGVMKGLGVPQDLERFSVDLQRLTGTHLRMGDLLKNALGSTNFKSILDQNAALRGSGVQRALDAARLGGAAETFEPSPLPRVPHVALANFDPSQSPSGRTATATEKLAAQAEGVAEGMDQIIGQVGRMSDLVRDVSITIQAESLAFQIKSQEANAAVIRSTETQSRSAQSTARWSLAWAILALVFSILVGAMGYRADREDASADSQEAAAMMARLEEQNVLLRQSLAQMRTQTEQLNRLNRSVAPPPLPSSAPASVKARASKPRP